MQVTARDYIEALRHKDAAEPTEIAQRAVARELGISLNEILDAPAREYRAQVNEARRIVTAVLAKEMDLDEDNAPTPLPDLDDESCDENGYYDVAGVKMREPFGRELIERASSPDVKVFRIVWKCTGKDMSALYEMPLGDYLPLHQFALKALAG